MEALKTRKDQGTEYPSEPCTVSVSVTLLLEVLVVWLVVVELLV